MSCSYEANTWLLVIKNPSMTTTVKISQNVDMLAKVALKSQTLSNLTYCINAHLQVKMSRPFLTGKSIVVCCRGWSK